MIFKRVWRSMKEEFKQRFVLNRTYLPRESQFGADEQMIRREDYSMSADLIAPVANPNISSVTMKLQTATAVKQSAASTPGYDLAEVELIWLDNLEVENVNIIYPGPGKVPPDHMAPNPKAMVENLKNQREQMKLEAKKIEWANQLMETQRVNNAKIRLLEAQALKAASEANAADAQTKIEAFNQLIEMHTQLGEQLNQRIATLLGESDGTSNDGAGVRGVEGKSGNQGDSGVSVSMPGGVEVSVGQGAAQPR
jgi:hypothetical protein